MLCAWSKFFRENVRFFTLSLFKIFFSQIFLFFKKLSKHFFLFKVILLYKTLFKHLYLQNSCYSSASAPRCVKNLTYACYLINLCQTPSPLHRSKQIFDPLLPFWTYYLSYFVSSSFQILIIFLIRP